MLLYHTPFILSRQSTHQIKKHRSLLTLQLILLNIPSLFQ